MPPVLFVDVSIIPERAGPGIVTKNAAVRMGGRPDPAVVVLGHPHRHLRYGLVVECKRPLSGIEGKEVAVKMGTEEVAAGEKRRKRACIEVIARWKRQGVLFACARFGVDQQQGVAAAMIVQPDQNDVPTLPVHGGGEPPAVGDVRRDAVVAETVAEFL